MSASVDFSHAHVELCCRAPEDQEQLRHVVFPHLTNTSEIPVSILLSLFLDQLAQGNESTDSVRTIRRGDEWDPTD